MSVLALPFYPPSGMVHFLRHVLRVSIHTIVNNDSNVSTMSKIPML